MRDLKIIRKADQKTSRWTGGTTTELAIYPEESRYADRNFLWRLSSAKVLAPESVFTSLPGVSRVLMVLDGEMELIHEGHYSIGLKPFKQDSFSGDWHSESRGCVTDFNLMTRGDYRGTLKHIPLSAGEQIDLGYPHSDDAALEITEALYLFRGSVHIFYRENSYMLEEGDLILFNRSGISDAGPIPMENPGDISSDIIRTVIFYSIKGRFI